MNNDMREARKKQPIKLSSKGSCVKGSNNLISEPSYLLQKGLTDFASGQSNFP